MRDVDAALPFYQALGFAIGGCWAPPFVQGPGGGQLLVDDPSGNPVELFEPKAR
jgi:hypothetical protein